MQRSRRLSTRQGHTLDRRMLLSSALFAAKSSECSHAVAGGRFTFRTSALMALYEMWQGEPMFLSLPGSVDAHTVKVNKDKRLIVGLENTMKLLSTEIGKEVPGVVSVGISGARSTEQA